MQQSYTIASYSYVLSNKPDDFSGMREPVLKAFQLLLDLLGMVQVRGERGRDLEGKEREEEKKVERQEDFRVIIFVGLCGYSCIRNDLTT